MILELEMNCSYCGTEIQVVTDMNGKLSVACPKCIDMLEGIDECRRKYGFDDIEEFIDEMISKRI